MKKLAPPPEWAIKMATKEAGTSIGESVLAHARTIALYCDEPEEPEFRAMQAALELVLRKPVQGWQVLEVLEAYRKALA